jgi:hypothetical protein
MSCITLQSSNKTQLPHEQKLNTGAVASASSSPRNSASSKAAASVWRPSLVAEVLSRSTSWPNAWTRPDDYPKSKSPRATSPSSKLHSLTTTPRDSYTIPTPLPPFSKTVHQALPRQQQQPSNANSPSSSSKTTSSTSACYASSSENSATSCLPRTTVKRRSTS